MGMVPDTTSSGINLARNPSYEVDSWGTTSGGTWNNERAWTGSGSLKFTFVNPSSGTQQYCVVGDGGVAFSTPVVVGKSYQMAFRWWCNHPAISARCAGFNFMTAAGNDFLSGQTVGNPGFDGQLFSGVTGLVNDWNIYQRGLYANSIIAPVNAVGMRTYITFTATAAIVGTVVVYLDGVHIIEAGSGELVPSYVDGNQGPYFHFTGTANRSTSYRDPIPTVGPIGSGGEIVYKTRYYKADKNNVIGDEISQYIYSGKINTDIDKSVQSTLTIQGYNADVIKAWTWIAVFTEISYEDGRFERSQRGLFKLHQPKNTGDDATSVIDVSGDDPSYALDYQFTDTYNIPVGTNVTTALRNLLALAGITWERLPVTSTVTGKVRSYKPGDKLRDALTSLTSAMGWFSVFADWDGAITTIPYRGTATTAPSRTYTLGQESELVGDIVTDRKDDSVFNIVIATRTDPKLGTLKAVARNDDPNSPTSTTYVNGPGIRTKLITVNEEVTAATLQKTADQSLADSSVLAAGTIKIFPDLLLKARDVVKLQADATQYPHLVQANGTWLVQNIEQGLTPDKAVMTVQMRRNELRA